MDPSLWCENPIGDVLGLDDADIYDTDILCGIAGGSSGNARRGSEASALSSAAATSSSVATPLVRRVETASVVDTRGRAEAEAMPTNDGAPAPASQSRVAPAQTLAAAYNENDEEIGPEAIGDNQGPMPETTPVVSEDAALKRTRSAVECQGLEIIEVAQGPIPDTATVVGDDAALKKSRVPRFLRNLANRFAAAVIGEDAAAPKNSYATEPIPDTANVVGDDAALKKSRVPRFLRNLATRFTATVIGEDVAAPKNSYATEDVEPQGPEMIEATRGPIPGAATVAGNDAAFEKSRAEDVERQGPEIIEVTQGPIPDIAAAVGDDAALKRSRVPRFLRNLATRSSPATPATRSAPATPSSSVPQLNDDNETDTTSTPVPSLMATLVQAVKGTLIVPNEQTINAREGPVYEAERVPSFKEDATHIYDTQPTPWWKKYHGYIYVCLLLTIAAMAVAIGLLANKLHQTREGGSASMLEDFSDSSSSSPIANAPSNMPTQAYYYAGSLVPNDGPSNVPTIVGDPIFESDNGTISNDMLDD